MCVILCCRDITSGNDDATLFHANSLDNVKGHHFSQHEATVNAARRGAAERLARISAGSVGNPCGTTICYSSSGFSDNNDAETIGQGIVGFASGASGSTSASSSKYQASALEGAAPIYPVAGGSKSSYVAGGYSPYPITNDALGRQFGAAGIGQLGTHTDLNELMTEAERLAKVQAQNAHNGAVSGSAAIDTENRFGGGSDDAVSGGTGGSGFQRTKSWSSSSKWASGQKYGDDGKVKSYSSLSTAESEQHNINGKKTGYKAATSTLEDDGKVSTYSLHTP
ncbi:hypothetical protein pipiens_003214 [Culex pipiens pipiens]|uniref:Uncharacterized protein n=1 Tax=Culex pipiens pipiens TaxID=38569 RepID=A0ABD1D1R1_CULPP